MAWPAYLAQHVESRSEPGRIDDDVGVVRRRLTSAGSPEADAILGRVETSNLERIDLLDRATSDDLQCDPARLRLVSIVAAGPLQAGIWAYSRLVTEALTRVAGLLQSP